MDRIAHFLDVHSHKLTFSYLIRKPGEMIKHDNGDRLVFILISSFAEAREAKNLLNLTDGHFASFGSQNISIDLFIVTVNLTFP